MVVAIRRARRNTWSRLGVRLALLPVAVIAGSCTTSALHDPLGGGGASPSATDGGDAGGGSGTNGTGAEPGTAGSGGAAGGSSSIGGRGGVAGAGSVGTGGAIGGLGGTSAARGGTVGTAGSGGGAGSGAGSTGTAGAPVCVRNAAWCDGDTANSCDSTGTHLYSGTCSGDFPRCLAHDNTVSCVCAEGTMICSGNNPALCGAGGMTTPVETCSGLAYCYNAACTTSCDGTQTLPCIDILTARRCVGGTVSAAPCEIGWVCGGGSCVRNTT